MAIISRHKPPDNRLERKIITAMITNSDYLKQVKEIYKQDSLRVNFTRIIAEWCLEFYNEFKVAPSRHIEDIFHRKTKINFVQDTADEIAEFLADLSEEYEQADKLNVEYLLKQTELHFGLTALDNLRVALNKAVISGNVEEGNALVKGFERVARQQTKGVDLFRDSESIKNALSDKDSGSTILRFPGEMGKVIGPLEREQFLCFVGNTGIGKSWILDQCGWWGCMQGHDTLVVSFEMNLKQTMRRTLQWMHAKPIRSKTIYLPEWDCDLNQNGTCPHSNKRTNSKSLMSPDGNFYSPENYPIDYRPCIACKISTDNTRHSYEPTTYMRIEKRNGISVPKAMKMRNMFDTINKRAGRFIFVRWPAKSKNVDDLRIYLQNLEEYEGIIPSIIITDYAEKMMPSKFNREPRHHIRDVFVEHKALAQERNALVITGHQGNTVRDGKDLKRGNWQEGVAGLNECDLSIMINQKDREKDKGLYRFLIGKKRDDEYSLTNQLWVTSCLSIGRPVLDSWYGR